MGVLAVLAGGGVWLWEDVLEDRLVPKRWGVVEEGRVFRSGQLHPALVRRTLERHGIDLVISPADSPGATHPVAATVARTSASRATGTLVVDSSRFIVGGPERKGLRDRGARRPPG